MQPSDTSSVSTKSCALEIACESDVGRVRPENEDNFAYDLTSGLLILADGMGGCQAGEVASAIAVSTVMRELRSMVKALSETELRDGNAFDLIESRMRNAIAHANQEIFELSLLEPHYAGMGTTLLAVQFHGDRVTVANVGDSRLYLLRNGSFQQITVDHTLLQAQFELGYLPRDEAQRVAARSILTRALGTDPQVNVDVLEQSVTPGDTFLLCSDGLYDMLEDGEISSVLLDSEKDLDFAAKELCHRANKKGGFDNITLILAKVS